MGISGDYVLISVRLRRRGFRGQSPLVKRVPKGTTYKKPSESLGFLYVVPPGIEPGTHGFSVRCSTN